MEEGKKSKVSLQVLKRQSTRETIDAKSMSRLRMRRTSFGFSGVPGIRPVERTSQIAVEFRRPALVYLNTYQLEPSYRFHCHKVRMLAEELLNEQFTNHKYNEQESPSYAMRLAGELMRKVKAMQFNRYRIIVVVTIVQKRAQSYNNAIAFIWDYERDNYIDVRKEVHTAFIQVTIFGVYLD